MDPNTKTLDNVYDLVGPISYYQIYLIFLIAYVGVMNALRYQMVVFTQAVPDHYCKPPDYYGNFSEADYKTLAIPKYYDEKCGIEVYSQCEEYFQNKTQPCSNGYTWDKSYFTSTAATEFNLTCTPKGIFLYTLSLSLFFISSIFGTPFAGWWCDTFGRKWFIITYSFFGSFLFLLQGYTTNVYTYLVYRFFQGVTGIAYVTATCYLIEIVPAKYRSPVGFSIHQFYCVGEILLACMAYFLRDWRDLSKFQVIFCFPVIFLYIWVPESPAYLFSKGEIERAGEVYYSFVKKENASESKKEKIRLFLEDLEESQLSKSKQGKLPLDNQKHYTLKDLFTRSKNLKIISLKTSFIHSLISIIYDGLNLSIAFLPGSIYTSMAIFGIVDMLANVISPRLVQLRIGQKRVIAFGLVMTCFCCLGTTFTILKLPCTTSSGQGGFITYLNLFFAFSGRFFITSAYYTNYQRNSELFPTPVRSNGTSLCVLASKIGNTLMPLILALRVFGEFWPGVVFSGLALLAAGLSWSLPDTSGVATLNSFEDAERLYTGEILEK